MGFVSLGLGLTNKKQWNWGWDLEIVKTTSWEMGFGQTLIWQDFSMNDGKGYIYALDMFTLLVACTKSGICQLSSP